MPRRKSFEMMRVGIIPAETLKISEEQLKVYQENHPSPIRPFAIVIRRQVEDFNKKKKEPILAILVRLNSVIISIFIIIVSFHLYSLPLP